MEFDQPLIPGTLLRRYKRFLADIQLDDGREITAHCANPGAMLGLKTPGMRVWLEPNEDPRRKLKYSWKIVELPHGHLAGIDTAIPNQVVAEALTAGQIAELAEYSGIRREVKYRQRSRVDFLLTEPGLPDCYLEVKNVHLRRDDDWAEFPDSVTARGAKHLGDLAAMVAEGNRGVMLYLVQRTDCERLKVASDLDPTYGAAFEAARSAGVDVLCYDCRIGKTGIWINRSLPVF